MNRTSVQGMNCGGCVAKIEQSLVDAGVDARLEVESHAKGSTPGVVLVQASAVSAAEIAQLITRAGFQANVPGDG